MSETTKGERLLSLDALRGADMLCIIGGASAVLALCRMFGWAPDCWLARQMVHPAWHWTEFAHHDTIFPLFLFLAGVSWPFSLSGQRSRGRTTAQILRKIGFRVAALFGLGIFMGNLFAFDFKTVRFDSVLFHIGFCWAVAAMLYMYVRSWKVRLGIAFALLAVHWLVLYTCTAPDAAALLASTDPAVAKKVAAYAATGTGNFSFVGNVAGWMDRAFVPGKLYEGIFDPDGLFGKVSGISLALFGVFAGELLRKREVSGNRKTLILAGAGVAALALTLAWSPVCPVNKKIWTSTFVLASACYAYLMMALFYWIIDVRGVRKWAFFFKVIGMNSITIYMLMRIFSFSQTSQFFFGGVASWGNADWSRFVIALGQVAVEWVVLWYLYRKNTFLRV